MPKLSQRKRTWILAGVTMLVVAYLVVMAFVASSITSSRMCRGVTITVHDTAQLKFINAKDLEMDMSGFYADVRTSRLDQVNIDSLERALAAFDKIEKVNVNILTNGYIHVDVWPLRPVARVFESSGNSYYINREGKRIKADVRYHLDVPVVQGDFPDSTFQATALLELIDHIEADSVMRPLVSMIKVDSPDNIILVPTIRGHVINFGRPDNFSDKFDRLKTMYRKVMDVRGWEFYDTISVKWNGQIVATRRKKHIDTSESFVETYNAEDVDARTMMSSEGIAPGQALPGVPVKGENPIPARIGEPQSLPSAVPPAVKADSINKENKKQ